jgi:hypothetical protein
MSYGIADCATSAVAFLSISAKRLLDLIGNWQQQIRR